MTDANDINALPDSDRARLLKHFKDLPTERQGEGWSSLWAEGTFLPWDQGISNPALVDLLASSTLSLQPGQSALVPGCGRGYDVHLLATHGIEATGLEISADAVREARQWVEQEVREKGIKDGGKAEIVEGDFYKRDWERKGGYDYVFDYTFLCAMPPALRPDWGRRMAEIVKPGGTLICIEFPLYKPLETGGPPFGVTEGLYQELLGENFERTKRYMPERTHKMGKGHDHLSIWRRKDGKGSVL